jgi:hypothetical protein
VIVQPAAALANSTMRPVTLAAVGEVQREELDALHQALDVEVFGACRFHPRDDALSVELVREAQALGEYGG